MLDDKLVLLVQQLHDQTLEGAIRWEATADESIYQIAFPNYTVRVGMATNSWGSQYTYILLVNQNGSTMEQITPGKLEPKMKNVSSVFAETYSEARRIALGLDRALDELLGILAKPNKELT